MLRPFLVLSTQALESNVLEAKKLLLIFQGEEHMCKICFFGWESLPHPLCLPSYRQS